MTPFIGAILLYLIAMIAFILGTVWMIRTLVNHTVGRRHRILEQITETGNLPEEWLNGGRDSVCVKKKLNELMEYVRKTRLVDSEETRALLLSKLAKAKVQAEE
jgi:flagellar biogenesis protein FliO